MNKKHIAKVAISRELLADMMTTGYQPTPFKCIEGLPAGAILVNAFINSYDDLELHFEHASFPVGESIITPTFSTNI